MIGSIIACVLGQLQAMAFRIVDLVPFFIKIKRFLSV